VWAGTLCSITDHVEQKNGSVFERADERIISGMSTIEPFFFLPVFAMSFGKWIPAKSLMKAESL
jgi:hypothetical protein